MSESQKNLHDLAQDIGQKAFEQDVEFLKDETQGELLLRLGFELEAAASLPGASPVLKNIAFLRSQLEDRFKLDPGMIDILATQRAEEFRKRIYVLKTELPTP